MQLNDSERIELILTNKHVIANNKSLRFLLHESVIENKIAKPKNESFWVELDLNEYAWIPHPQQDVDLGAIIFSHVRNHAKSVLNKEIFSIVINSNFIKTDDVLAEESDVADEVLMVGYPNGLWDEINNFPIIRKGVTASHPALDFSNTSRGVVDIACFPGSSGSPILICRLGVYRNKSGNLVTGSLENVILLGLLYGGPVYSSDGKIEIKEIPTQISHVATFSQMIHLGYYVKAKEILVLCEYIKQKCSTLLKEQK